MSRWLLTPALAILAAPLLLAGCDVPRSNVAGNPNLGRTSDVRSMPGPGFAGAAQPYQDVGPRTGSQR
jgi:hypothetical protein